MAAGNFIMYDNAKELIGDGGFDMDANTFKISLHGNGYTPNIGTHTTTANLTDEVANGFGYVTGGATLTSVTWGQTSGTATFDAADPTWTASGGSIGPFQYGVIYATDSTPANALLAYCQLETTELTANDGEAITIQINASGILTLSGADS